MDCLVCRTDFVIAADMGGHGDLACGRLRTDYLAFAFKRSNDLNAKVNVHWFTAMGGMMVEEAIVAISSQTFMSAEEIPNEIKRRPPDAANVSTESPPPHRGEGLHANGFRDNWRIHPMVPFLNLTFQSGLAVNSIRNRQSRRFHANFA